MKFTYLRNKISHEYFGLDYEIFGDVAINYHPENKIQFKNIISQKFM